MAMHLPNTGHRVAVAIIGSLMASVAAKTQRGHPVDGRTQLPRSLPSRDDRIEISQLLAVFANEVARYVVAICRLRLRNMRLMISRPGGG